MTRSFNLGGNPIGHRERIGNVLDRARQTLVDVARVVDGAKPDAVVGARDGLRQILGLVKNDLAQIARELRAMTAAHRVDRRLFGRSSSVPMIGYVDQYHRVQQERLRLLKLVNTARSAPLSGLGATEVEHVEYALVSLNSMENYIEQAQKALKRGWSMDTAFPGRSPAWIRMPYFAAKQEMKRALKQLESIRIHFEQGMVPEAAVARLRQFDEMWERLLAGRKALAELKWIERVHFDADTGLWEEGPQAARVAPLSSLGATPRVHNQDIDLYLTHAEGAIATVHDAIAQIRKLSTGPKWDPTRYDDDADSNKRWWRDAEWYLKSAKQYLAHVHRSFQALHRAHWPRGNESYPRPVEMARYRALVRGYTKLVRVLPKPDYEARLAPLSGGCR